MTTKFISSCNFISNSRSIQIYKLLNMCFRKLKDKKSRWKKKCIWLNTVWRLCIPILLKKFPMLFFLNKVNMQWIKNQLKHQNLQVIKYVFPKINKNRKSKWFKMHFYWFCIKIIYSNIFEEIAHASFFILDKYAAKKKRPISF